VESDGLDSVRARRYAQGETADGNFVPLHHNLTVPEIGP
jgi:hypothetical protein